MRENDNSGMREELWSGMGETAYYLDGDELHWELYRDGYELRYNVIKHLPEMHWLAQDEKQMLAFTRDDEYVAGILIKP